MHLHTWDKSILYTFDDIKMILIVPTFPINECDIVAHSTQGDVPATEVIIWWFSCQWDNPEGYV